MTKNQILHQINWKINSFWRRRLLKTWSRFLEDYQKTKRKILKHLMKVNIMQMRRRRRNLQIWSFIQKLQNWKIFTLRKNIRRMIKLPQSILQRLVSNFFTEKWIKIYTDFSEKNLNIKKVWRICKNKRKWICETYEFSTDKNLSTCCQSVISELRSDNALGEWLPSRNCFLHMAALLAPLPL